MTDAIALAGGILFLLIAVVGGGFTVRELIIPAVPKWARVSSTVIGVLFSLPFFLGIVVPKAEVRIPEEKIISPPNTGKVNVVPKAEEKIISPPNGGKVKEDYIASGTANNIPEGHQLWIIEGSDRYYTTGGRLRFSGDRWSGTIDVGSPEEAGQIFPIHLVEVGPDGTKQLSDHFNVGESTGDFPGIPSENLASDVSFLHTITVTRE